MPDDTTHTISCPRREPAATPERVFTRDLLRTATAQLLSWRQAAGAFGQLHLHACWGESSALQRRYHGQTIYGLRHLLPGVIKLHQNTGDPAWRLLADDLAANILYLQTRDGGFFHASNEFEPTYTCEESCPIHQGLPVLALLDYAAWPDANPLRVEQIKTAIVAWWRWFEGCWWKRGNAWKRPLAEPGFCGVTNQDLVIVAALARWSQVFEEHGRAPFENCGKPVLDRYLKNDYYHEKTGLFERGDSANFAERSSYCDIILPMLEIVHAVTGDGRLPCVIDNVAAHLFDALFDGPDGFTHLSWGAQTDPADKTRVIGWTRFPITFSSYPQFVRILKNHARRSRSAAHETACRRLEETLAAWVFADGTIPVALGADPLFAVAGCTGTLWPFLIDRLGPAADLRMDEAAAAVATLPRVHRSCGKITWKTNARAWIIERDGRRAFAGLKQNPSALAIGPDEFLSGSDLSCLSTPDVHETLSMTIPPVP
jgi:hypothetical protein